MFDVDGVDDIMREMDCRWMNRELGWFGINKEVAGATVTR